jgi:hypothetical protein
MAKVDVDNPWLARRMILPISRYIGFVANLALGLAAIATAAPVGVVNPGFEDITGENIVNEFTFGPLEGWQLHDPDSVAGSGAGPTYFIGTLTPFEPDPIGNPGVFANFPAGAAEGERVGIAFNFNGSDGQGEYGLFQELGATLQPFTRYTLDVEIGNITSATAMSGQFFPLEGFPGYRVELQAGGMMLEEDDNLLAGSIADGEFATSTLSFTTGSQHDLLDQPLGILLVNLNQEDLTFPNSDNEVDFDDVRLDASPALVGDFSFDGDADGLDFLAWQRGESDDSASLAELSGWQANYGVTAALVANPGFVPEPATLGLVALASLGVTATSRKRLAHTACESGAGLKRNGASRPISCTHGDKPPGVGSPTTTSRSH